MERGYRENVQRKRQERRRLTVFALGFLLLTGTIGAMPERMWMGLLNLGTNFMQPSLYHFCSNEQESGQAPLLLKAFAPGILSYTWEKERGSLQTAGQTIPKAEEDKTEVADKTPETDKTPEETPDYREDSVEIVISNQDVLAMIQENIYENRDEAVPNPFEDESNQESVLDPDAQVLKEQVEVAGIKDITSLIKSFYIVDASTSVDEALLDVDKLTSFDCRIDKGGEEPEILIYHSHSQEAFADSVPGAEEDTIVGAGNRLTELLEEEYGFQVLHHKGVYDVPSRDDAYSKALPDIESVLAANPSIQVVIDLHRDAVAEGTKLVQTIDGRDYARFMFFNGICRSQNGPITYLSNPYLQENLAFSFQSQVVAESYFPGITRKIYLKAWRYNMHFRPRNMLIELGAQTNTVEEVMNTCEILAFVINEVLSGQ